MESQKKAEDKAEKPEKKEPAFSKGQIIGSKKYQENKDILNALLEEKKSYTAKEVQVLLEKFQKGKVN